MNIPRPEHPRPQLERATWLNLNGTWTYEFDFGLSGNDRDLHLSKGFNDPITVPFCPESELSGVDHHDFIPAIWYHRSITIPSDWNGLSIRIHCGAIDYESEIFLDGIFVGRHFGGSASFHFDLSPHVKAGESYDLVIHAIDDTRSSLIASGKQSFIYHSIGCHYTRVTGIWQTVWLEAHAPQAIESILMTTDIDNETLNITPRYFKAPIDIQCQVRVLDGETEVARHNGVATSHGTLQVHIPDATLWSPENPHLYHLEISLLQNNQTIDELKSYIGMRKIHIEGNQVYLNNKKLYQRLVLDQGFYKTGVWTAPSDEALKRDIELSMAAGFNGARLHQKVFEERFHYWADRLGYLTWAESPSWGLDVSSSEAARYFMAEWKELVVRDRNHPSIIAWTPLNETGEVKDKKQHKRLHCDLYDLTQDLDPTRPINDASGYVHHKTDLWTVHNYEQDPEKSKTSLTPKEKEGVYRNFPDKEVDYTGQPYLVDEFGGIKWVQTDETRYSKQEAWGYGEGPKDIEEVYERLQGQVNSILELDHICGYCYTQLTDVEQEQNGIYNYDRSEKFDMTLIQNIFSQNPK